MREAKRLFKSVSIHDPQGVIADEGYFCPLGDQVGSSSGRVLEVSRRRPIPSAGEHAINGEVRPCLDERPARPSRSSRNGFRSHTLAPARRQGDFAWRRRGQPCLAVWVDGVIAGGKLVGARSAVGGHGEVADWALPLQRPVSRRQRGIRKYTPRR